MSCSTRCKVGESELESVKFLVVFVVPRLEKLKPEEVWGDKMKRVGGRGVDVLLLVRVCVCV